MINRHNFLLFLLVTVFIVNAHKVLLMVEDNEDGTIYIMAGTSTGGSVEGAKIVLKDKSTGQPLLQKEMPESGEMTVKMPDVPYTVTLDMGKGHKLTKTGPFIRNKENVTEQTVNPKDKKDSELCNTIIILIITIIVLLIVIVGIIIAIAKITKKE